MESEHTFFKFKPGLKLRCSIKLPVSSPNRRDDCPVGYRIVVRYPRETINNGNKIHWYLPAPLDNN